VIDDLRGLTAKSFPSDNASDQAKYGLGTPVIEATIVQADSAKKPEKVLISSPEKDKVHGAVEGLPTSYELEKASVEGLQRNIQELLKAEPEAEKKKETSQ
jgi:hypothetical protein